HAVSMTVKKFEGKVIVSHAGAADTLIELRRLKFFSPRAAHKIEERTDIAQTQLQHLFRICERIANERPVLYQPKWDDYIILSKLPLEVDLLLGLDHAD